MCVAKVRLPGGRQGRGRLPLPLPPFLYIYVSRYSSPTASNRRAIADPPPPENGEGGGGVPARVIPLWGVVLRVVDYC